MDTKDKLLRKALKSNNDNDWHEYRQARNKCNAKVKEAKRKYHRNLIEENKENPHKFWDAVKKVFPSKNNSSPDSTTKTFEKQALVNTFSEYFGSVVTKLKSKIILFSNLVWRANTKRARRTDTFFKFSYVSKIFVERQLKTLKRRKAAGWDDLPAGMIKDCRSAISKPLTYIINLSLKEGIVPTKWKCARVAPIHKSGDAKNPENYRPISVLPIFSKILERLIHTQLSKHLETNNLLTDYQFGYRSKRSTKLASTLLCDNIRSSIDQGNMVGAVFIDLTKAFDTVGHTVLLHKLVEYGIQDVEHEWFSDYLFHRVQYISVEGTSSRKRPLMSGVPQGSILGPLLFIMFFNDFPECLTNSKVIMYADDTVICFS